MYALPSRQLRSREGSVGDLVSAFESETAAVVLHTTPRHERSILYVIALMIVVAIVLMSITKLSRVVTAEGRIVPVEGTFYVQPFDKAIVKNILVKVGDVVKKGQILATLDPTFATADLAQLQQKVASDQALAARLEAEENRKPYVGGAQPYQMLQESIWHERQAEFKAGIDDFSARIRSDDVQVARAQQDVAVYQKRLVLATQIEGMNVQLEKLGFGSKLKTVIATDSRLDVSRQLSEAQHQISQSQQDGDALRAQRAVYIEKWDDDIATNLVKSRTDLSQEEQDLAKAEKMHQLVDLVSPRAAIVLKIGDASVGSVTGPTSSGPTSSPLFTLVPLDGPLEAEINIPAGDIGFLQVGEQVRLRLAAYDFIRHGTAEGKITTISAGSFTLNRDNQPVAPYFTARIAITSLHLRDVPRNFRLIPGMTLTGDIMVGHRTLMSYIIDGALQTGSDAMREP